MDDMPVTRMRFGAQAHSERADAGFDARRQAYSRDAEWAPDELQDFMDEVAAAPPTLRERMENWGSD